jgi:hypothetical protein
MRSAQHLTLVTASQSTARFNPTVGANAVRQLPALQLAPTVINGPVRPPEKQALHGLDFQINPN